jgi:hypothetical protein
MAQRIVLGLACLLTAGFGWAQPAPPPTPLAGLAYEVAFFPGTTYDATVPTVEELLGFRPGDRAALPSEVDACLAAWDAASPRVRRVEYARSHEGRPLSYMIVSAPENMARLDEIRAGLAALADPRGVDRAEADRLVDTLPATAWLAYSIHGDETSGTDAALAVLYHLTAGTNAEVTDLLRDLVILVDPMMNPDGRNRFLQQIAEHRATTPNVDDQSLLHSGYWPWGRGNHYLFDLNRDWLTAMQPETRGRIREAAGWHPLLFVDAHEMGALDTYLFAPARAPRNPHVPLRRNHWNDVFARAQSEAFDRHDWLYYTGEWNEGWYPGYSDSWAEYRGAVGILYEQAGYAEDAVRQASGVLTTYREAVHHQAVSSLANLQSLHAASRQLLAEFAEERRRAVAADGPYSGRTFAVLPTANAGRRDRLLDLLRLQGIEVWVAPREITGLAGIDQLGRRFTRRAIPPGTLLVPNRQPEAHWVATSLEFDTRMTDEYLERERKSILRDGSSSLYDLTAWNLTMLFGLEALTLDGDLPVGATRLAAGEGEAPPVMEAPPEPAVAWVVDGADDRSVAAAARLMERDVRVRVASRALELGGAGFPRGSVVVLPADNPRLGGDLVEIVRAVTAELGLAASAVTTGLGEGDLPDLGGGHFTLLEPPRIALVTRRGVSATDYGALWFTLDRDLGIRHSQIDGDALDSADLRRYNVIVLPDRWAADIEEETMAKLATWVEAGGTLIAVGRSASALVQVDSKLSQARELGSVLERLDDYELAILAEWAAASGRRPDDATVWSHAVPGEVEYPWSSLDESPRPSLEEREKRDAWERMFMPQGAFVAARVNPEHWLTMGVGGTLPVLFGSSSVLMAGSGVDAPVRFGVLDPAPGAEGGRVGWGPVPAGQHLLLRMSGLLWPEATQRLANSAYLTHEGKGAGQVILFAAPPTFRASTLGTTRLLLNAVVYGPGFGAAQPILPRAAGSP